MAGASAPRTVAVFDFDGTLTRGDTLLPFLRRVGGGLPLAGALLAGCVSLGLAPAGYRRDRAKEAVLARVLAGESVERLAPPALVVPSGRRVAIDYRGDQPAAAVRVQELFGLTRHPTVGGGAVPVVLHLLSPAGRPVQVTADLPGFWSGSWADVRKEMAGRYPKHPWPVDPIKAEPRRP